MLRHFASRATVSAFGRRRGVRYSKNSIWTTAGFSGLKMWSALAVAFVWNRTNGAMKLSESREVEVKVEGVVVVGGEKHQGGKQNKKF